jgi:hypothetical protein
MSAYRILNMATVMGLVAVLLTAGCATTVRTLDEGHSVAFGRVELYYDGEKVENLQGMGDATGVGVVLVRPGQEKAEYVPIAGSGEFYWEVGAGEYQLVSFQFFAMGSRRNIHVGGKFTIPASPTSVYVGDLIVMAQKFHQSVGIADRFDESLARLGEAYPGHPAAIVSHPLQPEAPIGEFAAVRPACEPAWGVDCEKYQYGVKPISPEHRANSYTMVDSLTPTFRWSGSSRADVHYDLVVRKSLACSGMVLFKEGLPGDIVLYVEDLREPHYTPSEPLDADTNYIWSVRFRDGDLVSDWSSTGHFSFFVVAYSWSLGDWFRFCTE